MADEVDFRNESGLEFTDVSSERWREPDYPGGDKVRIDRPLRLHVSESGGHRVYDAHGMSHQVPKGWIHLVWRAKDGAPHFVR